MAVIVSLVALRPGYSKPRPVHPAKLGIPEDLEQRLRLFESPSEFDAIIAEIRARHGERRTSIATALIKVPNGPVERW